MPTISSSTKLIILFGFFMASCHSVQKEMEQPPPPPQQQRKLRGPISNWIDTIFGRNLNCPPDNFNALPEFDLDSYISKSWYAVKQIPLVYQPMNNFYCVRADYIRDTSRCLLCGSTPKVKVYNQARSDSITGRRGGTPYQPNQSSNDRNLFRAFQKDQKNNPAKLTVGFFSQFTLRSNYWIVAGGTYQGALKGQAIPTANNTEYEWAIISAGSPDKQTENGLCIPKPGIIPYYGMWMFTRDGVPPTGVIPAIDTIATNLGLDATKWLPVTQEGCVF
jgi:hypothetical protein